MAQGQKNVAVFLDRDGVINEEVDLLYQVEQLRLIPGAAEAIQKLNAHDVNAIVVTNQPVVARGLCTEQDVEKIHKVLQRMLNEKGACLDAIYYCPHHENADLPQYRKACPDRKPNIGMLKKAANRFKLDLQRCFVVGDRTVDIQTGVNAGCRTILVKTGYGGSDNKYDVRPDYICEDFREAVDLIINRLTQGLSYQGGASSGIRKAVILCAGVGTRLRPLTERCPKVMLPLNGKPLLERHLDWLKRYGIREVYINLHHLPKAITSYFGDSSRFGIWITYSFEEKLRGTAGALNGFRDRLDETFLVHYGDVYSELDVTKMLRFHRRMNATATLVVHPTDRPHDSDVVVLNKHSHVISVHHKPGSTQYGNLGNAACYILEPRVLSYIPNEEGEFDFIQDVFPQMISAGEALYGYFTDEFLYDMGTFDRYKRLKKRLESR